jgi:hypothetical protein
MERFRRPFRAFALVRERRHSYGRACRPLTLLPQSLAGADSCGPGLAGCPRDLVGNKSRSRNDKILTERIGAARCTIGRASHDPCKETGEAGAWLVAARIGRVALKRAPSKHQANLRFHVESSFGSVELTTPRPSIVNDAHKVCRLSPRFVARIPAALVPPGKFCTR